MIAKVTQRPATPAQLAYRAERFADAVAALKAKAAAACADCAKAQASGADYLCPACVAKLNASHEEKRRPELNAGAELEPGCRTPLGGWNRNGDTISRGE